MRAMSLTALGLLLAPAAAYRLALPVAAAAQPRAACSMAGRAARVCSIDMMQNLDGTGSFRTVQEYPCDLDVKIIGDNEGPFVNDMVTLCAERTGQKEADVGVAAWSDVVRAAAEPTGPPTAPWLEAPSPLRTAAEPSYSRSGASPRRGPKRWFRCVVPHPGARWRDKGKYRAITLRLHFENADQVYDVYAAINRDPRVKFKL